MCLYTVDKKTKKGRGYGYKTFQVNKDGSLRNLYAQVNPSIKITHFPIETWIKDENKKKIQEYDFNEYPTGFHIHTSKKKAKNYISTDIKLTTRKVDYRNVVASGIQNIDNTGNTNVIVAREIYVHKEEV